VSRDGEGKRRRGVERRGERREERGGGEDKM